MKADGFSGKNKRLMMEKEESMFLSSRMMVNSFKVETTSKIFYLIHLN